MAHGHGGARPGAGRKRRAEKYPNEVAEFERMIFEALPAVAETLIARATLHADVAAVKILLDRAFGKPASGASAGGDDPGESRDEEGVERIPFASDVNPARGQIGD